MQEKKQQFQLKTAKKVLKMERWFEGWHNAEWPFCHITSICRKDDSEILHFFCIAEMKFYISFAFVLHFFYISFAFLLHFFCISVTILIVHYQ